jgi:hypothetical protein
MFLVSPSQPSGSWGWVLGIGVASDGSYAGARRAMRSGAKAPLPS